MDDYVMFLGGIYGEPIDSYLNVCVNKLIDMDPENSAQFKIPSTIKTLFLLMKYTDPMNLANDLLGARANSYIGTIFVFDPKTLKIYVHKGKNGAKQLLETHYDFFAVLYYNTFRTALMYQDLIDLRTATHSLN